MFKKVTAVEYNWLLSMIDYIHNNFPTYASDYGLSGISIDVLPAYPRDLTKMKKPSIIIQKINTSVSGVGIGNVLGLYQDETGAYDVYGKTHSFMAQTDVLAGSRTQGALITSLIEEKLFTLIPDIENDKDPYIPLSDYVTDIKNPLEVGQISLYGNIEVDDMSVNTSDDEANGNDDYRYIIRFNSRVIQPIADENQGMIDLSKAIKWTRTIKL